MAALRQAGVKVVPTGLGHGTITAVVDGRGFEITTLRRDVETDGRHAVVAFTEDWRLDASRRDFTINAMSMGRDGALSTTSTGPPTSKPGGMRFVGDPATRIAEDYLRILRFFRFYARYGRSRPIRPRWPRCGPASRFEPLFGRAGVDEATADLGRAGPGGSSRVDGAAGHLGGRAAGGEVVSRLAGLPADPVLRLAAMLTGDPLALGTRLKMSNEDRERLVRLVGDAAAEGSDADLRRLLADHSPGRSDRPGLARRRRGHKAAAVGDGAGRFSHWRDATS